MNWPEIIVTNLLTSKVPANVPSEITGAGYSRYFITLLFSHQVYYVSTKFVHYIGYQRGQ